MDNIIAGSFSILLSIILASLAWRYYRKRSYGYSLSLILLMGIILRTYVSLDPYLHEWDERYHALVAKNLTEQPFKPVLIKEPVLEYDYQDWGQNHVWLHKQPLSLWGIALSIFFLGPSEFAVRVPSILISTIAIFTTYQIGRLLFNEKVGLLAAFFHSINGLAVELVGGRTTTDHVDVFFQALIEITVLFAVYAAKDRRPIFIILTGLFLGASILTKWLPALIVIPLWFTLRLHYSKPQPGRIVFESIAILLIAGCVFLPWQIWTHTQFPVEATWESKYNIRHFFEPLEGHKQYPLYFIDIIRIVFGEAIYIPLAWLIFRSIKNSRESLELFFLTIWIMIPLAFFSAAQTKMQSYIFISAPAFFLLTALFILRLQNISGQNRFRIAANILIGLLFLLPIRYSIERIKPFTQRDTPQWCTDLKSFVKRVEGKSRVILLNEPHYIEAMFYGRNITARSSMPNAAIIDSLINLKYTVYIHKEEKEGIIFKSIYR
ncbi:MAG: glycosyltransferase family 39 protein [Lewinellaceae bacterium]|nr:glycosyltransferase family 39 protein [Lewinellaceae bacterium]